jgi:hypothetical protein
MSQIFSMKERTPIRENTGFIDREQLEIEDIMIYGSVGKEAEDSFICLFKITALSN